MKTLIASLCVLAFCAPAFGQDVLVHREVRCNNATVIDNGSEKYSLDVASTTQKAIVAFPLQNWHHNALKTNVGNAIQVSYVEVVYDGETYRAVTRTPTTHNVQIYSVILSAQTGTVTKHAAGKYSINIGTDRKVAFASHIASACETAFDAAATSGDPLKVGGYYAYRGKIGQPDYELWFVVERLP